MFMKKVTICLLYLIFLGQVVGAGKYPIGFVFNEEKTELHTSYEYAKADLANYSYEEHGIESEYISQIDFFPNSMSSCEISQFVQAQVFRDGILAVVCALSNQYQVYAFLSHTQRLQLPVIAPRVPLDLVGTEGGSAIRLQPPHLQSALLDLIHHYGHKQFIYLYNGFEGIHGLQAFHNRLNAGADSISIKMVKKFKDTAEALEVLQHIESSYRWTFKMIVLDCPTELAKKVLLGHVADHGLGRRTYHYLLSGFVFDEPWETEDLVKISNLNITGFRIVSPDRPIVQQYLSKLADQENDTMSQFDADSETIPKPKLPPILTAKGAFLYDCMLVLNEGLSLLSTKENSTLILPLEKGQSQTETNVPYFHKRREIMREFKKVKIEGLTGPLEFSEGGTRINYVLDVMEVNMHGEIVKIGDWRDGVGFTGLEEVVIQEEQRSYVVTSLLEEPFLMERVFEPGQLKPEGNERFEGFVVDLMDRIAERLNISYTLQIAKDGKHGSRNSSVPGGWNGMVGELVRYEADLGVGALTVNAEREMAIYLTKPFMYVGISIMIYKHKMDQLNGFSADGISADVFEFMRPLSRDTWICVGISYLGVCLVLFSIARFNRKELQSVEKHGLVKLRTQFSLSNSLWFTFASLVSQGTDICPKSMACRLVGSVWWFFTLILISSYTANFAAFQTANRMVQPINSVSDLVAQKKVTYGVLAGGSTEEFFKKSRVLEYHKMDTVMRSTKGANVKSYGEGIERVRREEGKYAFILESLKNDYTNRRQPCNTMRVGGNLDMNGFAIGLSKDTNLKVEDFSRIILEYRGSGMMDTLQNRWWPTINDCEGLDENIPKEERGRLSMKKLAGVFYVLIVGIIGALFISAFEVWIRQKNKNNTVEASTPEENLRCFPKLRNRIKFGKI